MKYTSVEAAPEHNDIEMGYSPGNKAATEIKEDADERKVGQEYLLPNNRLVRDMETGDNLSRLVEGKVESLYWVVGLQAGLLAPYFPEQRAKLEEALNLVVDAGLSTTTKGPFPENRVNRICNECNFDGNQRRVVKDILTSIHNFANFPALQRDPALSHNSYAVTDYNAGVKQAIARGLNEAYAEITVGTNTERPLPAVQHATFAGRLLATFQPQQGNIAQPEAANGLAGENRQLLAPVGSGDNVVANVARAVGGIALTIAEFSTLYAAFPMLSNAIHGQPTGSFFDNTPPHVNQDLFYNSLAIGGAAFLQGTELIASRARGRGGINTAGFFAGLMAGTSLMNGREVNEYLVKAALGVAAIQVADRLENIPIMNRVLGTLKETVLNTGQWAMHTIRGEAQGHAQQR